MKLTDLAPQSLWDQMVAEKMIAVQTHPTLPLAIYNYTQQVQFGRVWNAATLAARGLIADSDGNVVSKPFGKFFNYGELTESDLTELGGNVVVSDKLDGSMGVGYLNPETDRLNIATRGSFASDQALHATDLYLREYDGTWEPREGFTYLWEIVYPQNRIVLDYGSTDALMLIGRVDLETGKSSPLSDITEWPHMRAEVLPYDSLESAMSAPPRKNAEGVVVHFLDSDARVKLKQEDYVRLHRVVTGVTERRIWEMLKEDQDIDEWLAGLPEEFASYIREAVAKLQGQHDAIVAQVESDYSEILAELPEDFDQRDFAEKAKGYKETRGLLFSRHKGSDLKIWPLIRPEHVPLTGWGGAPLEG